MVTSGFEVPEDLRYTRDNLWLRAEGDLVRVGLTALAQDALGHIVHVVLPAEGALVEDGAPCCEVESTDLGGGPHAAPVTGRVVDTNDRLLETPELVNSDPYGLGWLMVVRPREPLRAARLLDAVEYRALVE